MIARASHESLVQKKFAPRCAKVQLGLAWLGLAWLAAYQIWLGLACGPADLAWAQQAWLGLGFFALRTEDSSLVNKKCFRSLRENL